MATYIHYEKNSPVWVLLTTGFIVSYIDYKKLKAEREEKD